MKALHKHILKSADFGILQLRSRKIWNYIYFHIIMLSVYWWTEIQTSQVQNYIFLDECLRPHTLNTRHQSIPILEYTTNLEKNVEKHPWEALCIPLLLLVNVSTAVQVIVNENLGLKAQNQKKNIKEQNVKQKGQSNKNNSISSSTGRFNPSTILCKYCTVNILPRIIA